MIMRHQCPQCLAVHTTARGLCPACDRRQAIADAAGTAIVFAVVALLGLALVAIR
jgi:uncharacterized OB-fold protein